MDSVVDQYLVVIEDILIVLITDICKLNKITESCHVNYDVTAAIQWLTNPKLAPDIALD